MKISSKKSSTKISNDTLILAALERSKKRKAQLCKPSQSDPLSKPSQPVNSSTFAEKPCKHCPSNAEQLVKSIEKKDKHKQLAPPSTLKGITILGIDPGSVCTGWGIIQELPNKEIRLVDCGAIRPKGDNFAARLGALFTELAEIVAHFKPTEAAVEDVHLAHNVASALKLGQTRGVVIAACTSNNVPVADVRPSTVKKALVGTGSAQKEQVSTMARHLLGIPPTKKYALDTTDALGIAIAYCNTRKLKQLLS